MSAAGGPIDRPIALVGLMGAGKSVVARVLAGDWGFWRTSRQSVEVARAQLGDSGLDAERRQVIDDRLRRLWERVEQEPKSLRWRSRAKIGDRSRWYEQPEEIAHR